MYKKLKKLFVVVLVGTLVASNFVTHGEALTNLEAPLMFEDFESSTLPTAGASSTVSIVNNVGRYNGSKVGQLMVSSDGWPDIGNRCLKVIKSEAIDVSAYTYLSYWVYDTGANGTRVSLIDQNNKAMTGDGIWSGDTVPNEWTQMVIKLTDFTGIDLTKVKGVYIGEWNPGTYLIDDIQFSKSDPRVLTVSNNKASGTYFDDFEATLSTQSDSDIYYTLDGSTPTTASSVYSSPITIDGNVTLKAVVINNGNIGKVYTYTYLIDHSESIHYNPMMVQTFDTGENPFTAVTGATSSVVTTEKYQGTSALQYKVSSSGSPETTRGSVVINCDRTVDVSGLKYLMFYIKDTQGNNTMKVSLIDKNGKETDFGAGGWKEVSTKKDKWSQYYVSLAGLAGAGNVDFKNISKIRIGLWNAGTYYIDSVYFGNYLFEDTPSLVPNKPESSLEDGYVFKDTMSVALTNDSCAKMYYTTNGSTPTTGSTAYTTPITLNATTTLKAISVTNGKSSEVASFTYTKNASVISDVSTNKGPGRYAKAFAVTLTNTDGTNIYYTLDGSNPTSGSALYEGNISITKSTVLKAVSYDGSTYGNVLTLKYSLPEVPLAVSVSTNKTTFNSATTIELVSDVDASIYYTTDGSEPTSASNTYTLPITIDKTTTLKMIAIRDGLVSEVTTQSIKIVPKAVKADKPAGTYTGNVIVEFRVPDSDKVHIYYTTDGSEPTLDSIKYVGPIQVKENTTFKVAATYMNSDSLSEVATHTFVITPLTELVAPEVTPSSGTYGDRQLVSMSVATTNVDIYYTLDGTEPDKNSTKYTNPFYATKSTDVKAVAIKGNEVSDVVTNAIKITTEVTPFLKTDGKVIRDNYGAGKIVQLKGTNVGGWLVMEEWQCPTNAPDQKTMIETLTNRFGSERAWELINAYQDSWFKEEDFDVLKAEGVNCLRLPITYFEMLNDDGSLKESAFDRLDWFVEEASKRDIYILIDMHGAVGSQNGKDHSGDISNPDVGNFFGNEMNIKKTIYLLEEIARRYKDEEWVCGYDVLNEPGGALGTQQWEVYDRIYDAIRAIDQNHIIQIQAIWEPTHLPDPAYYGWENVVYQYHFYGWDKLNDFDYQKAFVDSKVEFVNTMTNYNVPTFVGEFTFFENRESWDYALTVFDEQGWSYTSWTYKVAGTNSSWGMYTSAKTDANINTDSYDTILAKWTNFTLAKAATFTRNNLVAGVLSEHFKADTLDSVAPVISGTNAKITVGDQRDLITLLDLYIKDYQDGVIPVSQEMIETDFDTNTVGEYTVKVTVTDSAKNSATKTYSILVEAVSVPDDGKKPDDGQKPDTSIIPDDGNSSNIAIDKSIPTGTNVATGDSIQMDVYVMLGVISLLVGITYIFKKKKEVISL